MSLSIWCLLLLLLQAVGGLLKYLDDDLVVLNTSVVKSVFKRWHNNCYAFNTCLVEDTQPKCSRLSYYGRIMLSAKSAYAIKSFNLSSDVFLA